MVNTTEVLTEEEGEITAGTEGNQSSDAATGTPATSTHGDAEEEPVESENGEEVGSGKEDAKEEMIQEDETPDEEDKTSDEMEIDQIAPAKDSESAPEAKQEETAKDESTETDKEEVDTNSQEPEAPVAAPAPAEKVEATYSTRGRSNESSALDILADAGHQREAEISLPKEKEHTTIKPSFLSDSLTEEERRTRTRYLPDVDGFNGLRKTEIKSDLVVARCMTSSAGVANAVAKKVSGARDDDMDLDDNIAPSDEDKANEILRLGSRIFEVGTGLEYALPSTAFVAPSASTLNSDNGKPNPGRIDAKTAFNPPRPPESVGPKKKHRMLRWERRPADIEVDINTYRKTVQKTKDELKKAQMEKDRIEMLNNHLRRHFLNHLECMDEERELIVEETAKVQQECVNAADLMTSRTRRRGSGKSAYLMRDVLVALRSRGAEMVEKGIPLEPAKLDVPNDFKGVGGVGCASFSQWDNSKTIESRHACSGWVAPGDKGKCPGGEGVVVKVIPVKSAKKGVDTSKRAKKGGKDAMEIDSPAKDSSPSKDVPVPEDATESLFGDLQGPQIAVQLSTGAKEYYSPDEVEPMEDPSSFADNRLVKRWQGLMETAPLFGETVDVEAMANHLPEKVEEDQSGDRDGDNTQTPGAMDEGGITDMPKARIIPFGSNLLPSNVGRGALVAHTNSVDVDKILDNGLFQSVNLLGRQDNPGVPAVIRKHEQTEKDRIYLKARLRQLRNEVNRQRRIRLLNQRTHAAAEERALRIEALVSEMRTDLKSLKRRLDEEVRGLGIDEAEADKILQLYNSRHKAGEVQESPFKRSRNAEMDFETEDEDGAEQAEESGSPEQAAV